MKRSPYLSRTVRRLTFIAVAIGLPCSIVDLTQAQAPFFQGKTVTIIQGTEAGGHTGQVATFEVSPGEIAALAFARAAGEEICTLVRMRERRGQRGQHDQAGCRHASRCRDVPAHAANLSTARRPPRPTLSDHARTM